MALVSIWYLIFELEKQSSAMTYEQRSFVMKRQLGKHAKVNHSIFKQDFLFNSYLSSQSLPQKTIICNARCVRVQKSVNSNAKCDIVF